VTEAQAGTRLEAFVRERFAGSSLTQVRRVIADAGVRVNGKPEVKGYRLRAGDRVNVGRSRSGGLDARAGEDRRLLVVYEDAELLAWPSAGVPSTPLRPEETNTAANGLVDYDASLAGLGRTPRDAGLISRLDTGRAACCWRADEGAFRTLLESSRHDEIAKGYLALVEGCARRPGRRGSAGRWRRTARGRDGGRGSGDGRHGDRGDEDPAHAGGVGATLVVAEIRQGERQQIRAHLAAIGHPVGGRRARGRPLAEGCHALHADGSSSRTRARAPDEAGDAADGAAGLRAARRAPGGPAAGAP